MKTLISCTNNMDNCCVELKLSNGSMLAIDTIGLSPVGWLFKPYTAKEVSTILHDCIG